ncbi:MAG: hypothetical protein WCF23_22230 [Candidatus Nitrosopolaris sp.]
MTSRIIVNDTATAEGQRVYNKTDPSRVCTKCVHFQVCTIHISIHRAMGFDFPEICTHFTKETGI